MRPDSSEVYNSSVPPLPNQILAIPPKPQTASPLFQQIPAEIRTLIFHYALTDHPDPASRRAYSSSNCFNRPGYQAPPRSDTALVRTCRAIYEECWALPFELREQTFWADYRREHAPPRYQYDLALYGMRRLLSTIRIQRKKPFEFKNLRVFSHVEELDKGALIDLLRTKNLNPRVFTVAIRHTDWDGWETDQPLRLLGKWIPEVSLVLPSSVQEVHLELESVARKKYQVDILSDKMMQKWFFKRSDGAILYASSKHERRWKGTSRWGGKRWLRDETVTGVIDYYIVVVTFRLENALQRDGRSIHSDAIENAKSFPNLPEDRLKLDLPGWQPMKYHRPYPYIIEDGALLARAIGSGNYVDSGPRGQKRRSRERN